MCERIIDQVETDKSWLIEPSIQPKRPLFRRRTVCDRLGASYNGFWTPEIDSGAHWHTGQSLVACCPRYNPRVSNF